MILKNMLLKVVAIITLCFCLLLFPSYAFSLWSDTPTTPTTDVNLPEVIDAFLSSIPNDYYAVQNIDRLKNTDNALLIDVREPSEYLTGHIPKAINIPLRTLTQNFTQIPHDQPVILYCSTGYRTAMGVMTLQLLGYNNVSGFPPSINGWTTAGEILEIFPEKFAKVN